jgi:hypothetical protein
MPHPARVLPDRQPTVSRVKKSSKRVEVQRQHLLRLLRGLRRKGVPDHPPIPPGLHRRVKTQDTLVNAHRGSRGGRSQEEEHAQIQRQEDLLPQSNYTLI